MDEATQLERLNRSTSLRRLRDPQKHGGVKNTIVTGASRGLGKAIATRLTKVGHRVVNFSRSAPIPVDIREPSQVTDHIKRIHKHFGKIDVVVNSAGYVQPLTSLSQISDEMISNSFRTNSFGPFFVMRSIIPIMKKQGGGMIVNVASKSAIYTVPRLGAYSASKAALLSLTESAAKELRNTNVLCVTVCPSGMRNKTRAAIYGRLDASNQQSPQRVAGLVAEIIENKTANGTPISQGSCVIIRKDEVTVEAMEDG